MLARADAAASCTRLRVATECRDPSPRVAVVGAADGPLHRRGARQLLELSTQLEVLHVYVHKRLHTYVHERLHTYPVTVLVPVARSHDSACMHVHTAAQTGY